MPSIPTAIPKSLRAGDTWQWTHTAADYPASAGWTLTYTFKNLAGGFEAPAVADGDAYAVTVDAATSAPILPGTYDYIGAVELAGVRATIATGVLRVDPNLAAGSPGAPYDARSRARTAYDSICAVLENRATKDQESYSIAGRALAHTPIEDLIALKSHFAMELQNEDILAGMAAGLGNPRNGYVIFRQP